jgi:ATP-binding cassette subfamily F protein uup
MSLLEIKKASLHYGTQVLLDSVDLKISKGQRICLMGRNGAGKSTLLKAISGQVELDEGEIWIKPGVRVARLEQDLPEADDVSVFDAVAQGLDKAGQLIIQYHELLNHPDDIDMDLLADLQQQLDAEDGWMLQQRVETVLSRLSLPAEKYMRELSGGWRRRVSLARALVTEPDVLMLDEPTNHLDVMAIEWLEQQILNFNGAVIFITHDRQFLQNLATDIVELDRGHTKSWHGTYDQFLAFREQQLLEEERHNALFDKRLNEEEKWIRQGIKARRTRNEGRVRALESMRNERMQRRAKTGNVSLEVGSSGRSGKLVAELHNVTQNFSDNLVINNLTTTIIRGDRIGFIGPNGAGKSTLLKIILGQLQPTSGDAKCGTSLSVAYFDQLREQLDLEKNVVENIAEGRDSIEINGKSRHIISYLSDFLFTGARARTPVKALSGGERNRVLLAKLFSKECNLLVLDEPTNDLDVETLELLEEVLVNFPGTILLVSHDRAFLDNVVTSTLAFEGSGNVREYVGGYADWIRQGGVWNDSEGEVEPPLKSSQQESAAAKVSSDKGEKLSYKLQRELDGLPAAIDLAEQEVQAIEAKIAAPDFYQQDASETTRVLALLEKSQQILTEKYARWEELDEG